MIMALSLCKFKWKSYAGRHEHRCVLMKGHEGTHTCVCGKKY